MFHLRVLKRRRFRRPLMHPLRRNSWMSVNPRTVLYRGKRNSHSSRGRTKAYGIPQEGITLLKLFSSLRSLLPLLCYLCVYVVLSIVFVASLFRQSCSFSSLLLTCEWRLVSGRPDVGVLEHHRHRHVAHHLTSNSFGRAGKRTCISYKLSDKKIYHQARKNKKKTTKTTTTTTTATDDDDGTGGMGGDWISPSSDTL